MAKTKSKIIYDSELNPKFYKSLETIDLSDLFHPDSGKVLTSIKITINGEVYWKAKHHTHGIYWTNNENDPKILNTSAMTDTGDKIERCRGNVKYTSGEVARASGGRPKGAVNRQSVAVACANLNVQPSEFLAAVVAGNVGVLRKYRVKNPNDIPLTVKIKVAETLLHKLQGNARPVDVDAYGEKVELDATLDKNKAQIQVYIPSQGTKASIAVDPKDVDEITEIGIEAYLDKHKNEVEISEEPEESEGLKWEIENVNSK